MKRVLATALLAGVAAMALTATTSFAGTNLDAKIMLHSLPLTGKNPCVRAANLPTDCTGYNLGVNNTPSAPGTLRYIYLLVINGGIKTAGVYDFTGGIAGVQCGIQYPGGAADGVGLDVSWVLCSTLQFITPTPAIVWPESGGGNLMTWDATGAQCTTPPGNATIGGIGVAGYFYAGFYPGVVGPMCVTPRPVDGVAKVANCGSQEDITFDNGDPSQTFLGCVGFGNQAGRNPCGRERPVAVEQSTWSNVKTLLNH